MFGRSSCIQVLAAILACALVAAPAVAVEPGDTAPSFSLPALDGKTKVSLASHRGKVVWLDFWASWCPPCLSSLPELEKLRQQLPADQFQIVAVNLDEDQKKALRFLERHPVGYPSGSDPKGSLPDKYGLKTMPTSYLIDRNGVVRVVHEGYRDGDMKKIKSEVRKWVEKK
jgi:peroxiredoxin